MASSKLPEVSSNKFEVSNTSALSTTTQSILVPSKVGSSVIVWTALNPSNTWSSITTELAVADLTPNLSTAFIKYFPAPTNGVTTEVAVLAILGTSTVVFA